MRIHPVISILLAAWIGLGSTLAPRYLCSCADGTVTVEFGRPFCCDSDDSCCESHNSGMGDRALGDVTVAVLSCGDGCESSPLAEDILPLTDRACELRGHPSPEVEVDLFHSLCELPDGRSFPERVGSVRDPMCRAITTAHLRSVILLV